MQSDIVSKKYYRQPPGACITKYYTDDAIYFESGLKFYRVYIQFWQSDTQLRPI